MGERVWGTYFVQFSGKSSSRRKPWKIVIDQSADAELPDKFDGNVSSKILSLFACPAPWILTSTQPLPWGRGATRKVLWHHDRLQPARHLFRQGVVL